MKNYVIRFLIFLFAVAPAIAQPVSDNATIPVSITLNSILRLQVVKGGNIDFVVNTLNEFTDGIANSDGLDTRFTVASSVDFDVNLYAADLKFFGTDIISASPNDMDLANVGYIMEYTGVGGTAGTTPATDSWALQTALIELKSTATKIVSSHDGNGAGDKVKNDFTINWELATANVQGLASGVGTLLSQNLNADRYSTNVFLVLTSK